MRSGAHNARFFVLFPAGAAGPPQGDRLTFIPMQKAQRRIPVTHRTPGRLLHRPLELAVLVIRLDRVHAADQRAAHVAFGRDDLLGLRYDLLGDRAGGRSTTPSRSPST